MPRDIDEIIRGVQLRVPEAVYMQMPKYNPGDDDNLWFFTLSSEKEYKLHIESIDGNCPFLVEARTTKSSEDALKEITVERVVEVVCSYLKWLKDGKVGPAPF